MGFGKWLHDVLFVTDPIKEPCEWQTREYYERIIRVLGEDLASLKEQIRKDNIVIYSLRKLVEKRKYKRSGKYVGRFIRNNGVGINLPRNNKTKRKMSYYHRQKLSKALRKYHDSVPVAVKRERIAKMMATRMNKKTK